MKTGTKAVGAMKRVRATMNDKLISHTFGHCHTVSEGVNFVTHGLVFLNTTAIQIGCIIYSENLIFH